MDPKIFKARNLTRRVVDNVDVLLSEVVGQLEDDSGEGRRESEARKDLPECT